ncbi:MAG: hypothetical protein JNK23_03960 [Opitutaceae bacterium]|nr:hypothetical protein [Opitutaceae bacterium]
MISLTQCIECSGRAPREECAADISKPLAAVAGVSGPSRGNGRASGALENLCARIQNEPSNLRSDRSLRPNGLLHLNLINYA